MGDMANFTNNGMMDEYFRNLEQQADYYEDYENEYVSEDIFDRIIYQRDLKLFGDFEDLHLESMILEGLLAKTKTNNIEIQNKDLKQIEKEVVEIYSDIKNNVKSGKEIICPECKNGIVVIRKNKQTQKEFLGCSCFPTCRWSFSYEN